MKPIAKRFLIIFLAFLCIALSRNATAKDPVIRISSFKDDLNFLPINLGIKLKYFHEEKLGIEPVHMVSCEEIISSLRNGKIDLSILPSTKVFLQNEKQLYLTILSCISSGSSASIWTSKIKNIKDLKGKKIVIPEHIAFDTSFVVTALENFGLERGSYKLLYSTQSAETQLIAVSNRKIEASVAPRSSYFLGKEMRLNNLIELKGFLTSFPSFVVAGRRDWVQGNSDLIIKFLTGQIKSQWFMNYNLNETINISRDIYAHFDPELLEEIISFKIVDGLIPPTCEIDTQAYAKGIVLFMDYYKGMKKAISEVSEFISSFVSSIQVKSAKEHLCKKCLKLPSCPPK